MLRITIPGTEQFNDETQEFVTTKEQTLALEHSLVSLSKWESKWQKPFLDTTDRTPEEVIDYVRCMTITQNVDPTIYYSLTPELMKTINDYIEAPMTATWFGDSKNAKPNREVVTSEVIYYWMIALEIPFECQKWHLNRLLTLIQVCNIKNQPPKKMDRRTVMEKNRALNQARRSKFKSRG